nr:AAA family ATPase [Hassalia byssoidea]
MQIRDRESQLRELEREIQQLNGIKAGIEENNAGLKQEKEQFEDDIRRIKGEIENLENSSEVALRSLKERLWLNLPNTKQNIEDEHKFLEGFVTYIQSQGLAFPKRVIHAFHTSLKVQDISALVILAGISGTGKSELPQKYADYIGAQLLTLAVQPRWDSPQDLQGFYNYVEKKFKPTDLMRGLYQYSRDSAMENRIVIVLLDEMNLARVEYYFSEFLSKLETRRSRPTYLEIDVGSLPLKDNERRLEIPNQFLFVGTMNEDETTQSLSDKVLDRANVITFGKPKNLQLRQQNQHQNGTGRPSGYLAYSDLKQWTKIPEPQSDVVEKVKYYLDRANNVMEKMGHPFAHRVYQGITQYVVNYPMVESAFNFALADQFGQKLLPKLRGVMIDEAHEELEELEKIIAEIGDYPLIEAFRKAREGRYGQFQWQGLVYQDERAI